MYMRNNLQIYISMQRHEKNTGTGTEAQPGSLSIHYTFSSPTLGASESFSSPASSLGATVGEPITRTDDWLPPCMFPKLEVLPVPGGAISLPNGVLFERSTPGLGVTLVEWKTFVRPRYSESSRYIRVAAIDTMHTNNGNRSRR